jgi:hypothetical protein
LRGLIIKVSRTGKYRRDCVMKKKNLIKMAALLVAIASFAVAPAKALTSREAKELKATILSVPVPEMPAKGAELVTQASKENREAVAVTLVKAVVFKHRAAAPLIVSAISKAAPDVAPAVSAAAAEISSDQAVTIAHAAAFQAPSQASEISAKVMQAVPSQSRFISANLQTASSLRAQEAVGAIRGAAAAQNNGNTSVSDQPIDYTHSFPATPPSRPAGAPVVVTGARHP